MPAGGSSFDRRPIEVWLIDDNDPYTAVVSDAINLSDDIRCTATFSRCEPALEQLRNGTIPPHVILLDIGLPGISGIQAIQTFKQFSARMQIVMLTVFDVDEKVTAAVRKGASGYLLKTSTMEEILKAVRASLQGGMPLDPMVTRNLLKSIQRPQKPANDYGLTEREEEILRLLVEGLTLQQMADRLFISPHTVITHIRHINTKLGVNTRSHAVVKALKENLV